MYNPQTKMEVLSINPTLYWEKLQKDLFYGELPFWGCRNLEEITPSVDTPGLRFNFKHLLGTLSQRFPGVEPLEILEGGCGRGNASGELKKLGRELGREVRTTGVTLNPNDQSFCEGNEIDTLMVGPLEMHHRIGSFSHQFHFILDSHGAAYYGPEEIVPLYDRLLLPGGFALLTQTPVWHEVAGSLIHKGLIVSSTDHQHVLAEKPQQPLVRELQEVLMFSKLT